MMIWRRLGRAALTLVCLALLLGSWVLVYGLLMISTEAFLVPWDVVPGRPPVGRWARAVNDFFEVPPGSQLPAVLVVLASGSLLVNAIRRRRLVTSLLFVFSVFNLLFVVVSFLLGLVLGQVVAWWLPYPQTGVDVGFHRTWPQIVMLTIMVSCLLLVQLGLGVPERQPHGQGS